MGLMIFLHFGKKYFSGIARNATAFTGKSDFYNTIFFIDDVILRLKEMKPFSKTDIHWLPKDKMSDQLGFSLDSLQYKRLCGKLDELCCFTKITEVSQLLQVFAAHKISEEPQLIKEATFGNSDNNNNNNGNTEKLIKKHEGFGKIDSSGRAISLGYRKTAVAKVFMTPGTGTCHVNGKLAVNYFYRPVDMFKLAEPFRVTQRFGKYNVWALTRGGGETGQAGAISLAISRALVVMEPSLKHILYPWGCLKRDSRIVERKKPGQEKARKKFTWVKR